MTNHPTGDTALSRAITTGAPVATNDKQAAELTQKWGVWCQPKDGSEQRWAQLVDFGGVCQHRVFTDRAAAEHCRIGWEGHDGDECNYEVRPYPTPTPRLTPGGEWTTRENLLIRGDNFCANVSDAATARDLAQRLNAADAMEAENKRLRQLLELAAMMSDSKADTLKTWSKFQDAGYEQREDKREGFTEFLHREIAAALRGGA